MTRVLAAGITTMIAAALVAGCSGSSSAPPVSAAEPLADVVASMEPRAVWQHFHELTQVPRPSHHEARATAFAADFGRRLGLETIVDAAGNVVIRKPATPGRESRAAVVLQSHLDMVGQAKDPAFDFQTTPVAPYVQDGWVFADGTTLGADDGIGVAMILAILEADDLVHGPIEALFTTNEEDGMDGMNALDAQALRGRLYLNVDNEVEGSFVISSAGAVKIDVRAEYGEDPAPAGATALQVAVGGLIGGHSGIDIGKGRASAHQLLARLLVNAPAELGVRVASLAGGDTYNVIPSRATALVTLPAAQVDGFRRHVAGLEAAAQAELAGTDPGVTVTATPAELPPLVMERTAQAALLGAIADAPQGVYRMSADIPGLVETSCNLGVLRVGGGSLEGGALARSAVDAERDAEAERFAAVFERAGATAVLHDPYASWPPNPASPLLALMQRVFAGTFGADPVVTAVHAGLETSVAGTKFPGMDMISVGPTMRDVHSPGERLEVASVPRAYALLVATLAAVE